MLLILSTFFSYDTRFKLTNNDKRITNQDNLMLKVYHLWKKPRYRELFVREQAPPTPARKISAYDVEQAILRKFGFKPTWFWTLILSDAKIYIGDPWYSPVTEQDLQRISNICKEVFKDIKYRPVIFDCDDFVRVMMGQISLLRYKTNINYAFGYVWIELTINNQVYGHATCFYIDENLNFRWYEPQLCMELDFDQYKPKLILAVI